MKKTSLFALLTLILSLCNSTMAGIQGSKHDLSVSGVEQEICVFCHTPAGALAPEKPLWEKNISTTQWTESGSAGKKKRPNHTLLVSKLCLSCHDSTLGQEIFIYSSTFIKTHPIGSDMRAISRRKMRIPAVPMNRALKLFNNRVECATCHDVHNSTGYQPLLVMQNLGSALCLSCHMLNTPDTNEERTSLSQSSEETIEQEMDTTDRRVGRPDTSLLTEERAAQGRSSEETIEQGMDTTGQRVSPPDTSLLTGERAAQGRSSEETIEQGMDTTDQRVVTLEKKVSELESRISALEGKINAMTAELEAAKKAVADAQDQIEALKRSADRAEDSAKRTEVAVDQAAAAVGRAETAAKKAEKALDLLQKK